MFLFLGLVVVIDGGRQTADGGRQTADGRRQTADDRRRTNTWVNPVHALPFLMAETLIIKSRYQRI